MIIIILTLSVLLQFTAAILALRLIFITGKKIVWGLIVTAIMLMVIRRCIPLIHLFSAGAAIRPDLNAEIIGLVISLLMVAGISRIAPIFTERKHVEEALRQSEERFAGLFEQAPLGYQSLDANGHFLMVNEAWLEMLGYKHEEVIGKWFGDFLAPQFVEAFRQRFPLFKAAGHIHTEFEMLHKNGEFRLIAFDGRIGNKKNGSFEKTHCILHDITERKLAEEHLQASLKEKELLIREVHHRVKNNMQVMSGLLDLQASSSSSPELTAMLKESQRRIRAMAMVHEKLYDSDDLTRIDLAAYVKALSQKLFQAYKINPGKIGLVIKTDGAVYVDIGKATPCGLVLNELISNALKHAFPGDKQGKLEIIIHETEDTEIEIVVRDNGSGMLDNIDINQSRSVGLHLVNGLVINQLHGQIEVRRDGGTEFRITFPLSFVEGGEHDEK